MLRDQLPFTSPVDWAAFEPVGDDQFEVVSQPSPKSVDWDQFETIQRATVEPDTRFTNYSLPQIREKAAAAADGSIDVLGAVKAGIEAKIQQGQALNMLEKPAQDSREMSTTYGGPPAKVAGLQETIQEPLEELTNPAVTLPRFEITAADAPEVQIGKEFLNVAAGLPEFASSKLGVLTAITAPAAPTLVGAAYSADMLHSLGKQVADAYENWGGMSPEQKRVAVVDAVATGLFTALAASPLTRKVMNEAVPARKAAAMLGREVETAQLPAGEPWREQRQADIRPTERPETPFAINPEDLKSAMEFNPAKQLAPMTAKAVEEQFSPTAATESPKTVGQAPTVENNPPAVATPKVEVGATPLPEPPAPVEMAGQTKGKPSEEKGRQEEGLLEPVASTPEPIGEGVATSIPQGPGARTLDARQEAPESYEGTGLKNAIGEVERAGYGLPEATPTERRAMGKAWIASEFTTKDNPIAGQTIVDRLKRNPGSGLTDLESAVLLRHKVTLMNQLNAAAERTITESDPAVKAEAQAQYDVLSNQLLELLDIAKSRGSEWGREGRWRQAIAREDFSFASMETRLRAEVGGRELTEGERAKLVEIANAEKAKAEEYRKKLDELQAQRDEADAKRIATQAEADAAKANLPTASKYVIEIAEKLVKDWDTAAEAARTRLRERMTRMSAGVDPTVLYDLAIVGRSHLGHIGLDFAKWSSEMVKDIGEAVKPHLEEVFKRAKGLAEEDISKRTPADKKKAVRARINKSNVTPEKAKSAIVERLAKRFKENTKMDLQNPARKLARIFYAQGITEPGKLVDAVHETLKPVIPGLTRRATMDALSGYGNYTTLSKDSLTVALRDVYGQLQQIGKLEDMAQGQAPKKSGFERRVPSDTERRLIKQVEEKKKEGGYTVTDPEGELRTAMQAAETRLTNQIKDLEHEIATREKIVKGRRKLEYDDKLNALRERRDELKAVRDEIFRPPELTDAERLARWKQRALEKIEDYKERIAQGDLKPPEKPKPVKLDNEALHIQFQLEQIHKQWMEMRANARKAAQNALQKSYRYSIETANAARVIMTAFDLSAVLRQGKFAAVSRPITAARAIVPMLKAFRSEESAFKVMEEIRSRENAPLYKEAKLYLSEMGGTLSHQEEAFMSSWAHRIPGVAGSGRAYITFLNKLRADSFDAMAAKLTVRGVPTLDEAKAIANFVNVSTGRGAGFNQGAASLNAIFFAPRYVASRFQIALGQPLLGGTMRTRKVIAEEYVRTLTGLAVYYGLVYMAASTFANVRIGAKATSSDYGKIILDDNTRIDPAAGTLQGIVLANRVISGETTTIKGKTIKLRGPKARDDAASAIGRFARSKLAPLPGTALDVVSGKDIVGKPIKPLGAPWEDGSLSGRLIVPLGHNNLLAGMKAHGIPAGLALEVLSIFGEGVNTYHDSESGDSTESPYAEMSK